MASEAPPKRSSAKAAVPTTDRDETESFDAIVRLIDAARQRAYQAVNTALIDLYWQIGENISRRIAAAEWGDGVVERLAAHIARRHPGLRGFTRPNLFRMRQFYEAYASAGKQTVALLRQVPWTHHLIILGQSKRADEREFYLRLGRRAALGQARARAPGQDGPLRARRAGAARSLTSGETKPARGGRRLQGRLRARLPGPAAAAHRGRPACAPAGPAAPVPDRARA
jgi:predicted nuclease of restriction endonuclease-like (RecB) superfamily